MVLMAFLWTSREGLLPSDSLRWAPGTAKFEYRNSPAGNL